jgi:hypothetical protein
MAEPGKVITSGQRKRRGSWNRYTSAGTVSTGARSVEFYNSGAADDPTVDGVVLKQGESIYFDAGGVDDVLGAIPYNPGTSELIIAEVR